MGQTGADIIDLDFPTPLGHARRAMRETQVLLGNIDPVRDLRDGTPASVEAALAECYRQGGGGVTFWGRRGGGRGGAPRDRGDAALAESYRQAGAASICGAGCEVPRATPHANVEAMARFARSRG